MHELGRDVRRAALAAALELEAERDRYRATRRDHAERDHEQAVVGWRLAAGEPRRPGVALVPRPTRAVPARDAGERVGRAGLRAVDDEVRIGEQVAELRVGGPRRLHDRAQAAAG